MISNAIGLSTSEKVSIESITWKLKQNIFKMFMFITCIFSTIFKENIANTQDDLLALLSVF